MIENLITIFVYILALLAMVGAAAGVIFPRKKVADWLVSFGTVSGALAVLLGVFFDVEPKVYFYISHIPLTWVVFTYLISISLMVISGGMKGDWERRVWWAAVLILLFAMVFSINNASLSG